MVIKVHLFTVGPKQSLREERKMATREEITDFVFETIFEELGVERKDITLDSSFTENLGADSLNTVEIMMAFEDKFGIDIPEADAEFIVTVGQAIDYIESHQS